jgi:hypothetical protein
MPDNTLPMMTGFGQFGPIEMGGMFTVMKIREGLARNDYRDPGDYQHPAGTVAYEVKDPATEPQRRTQAPGRAASTEVRVVKPGAQRPHRH